MTGFCIDNTGLNLDLRNNTRARCLTGALHCDQWAVQRNTLDRFLDDKALFEDDECVLVLEGVILNKEELFELYEVETVIELVKAMKAVRGETFFNDFRGSFSGACYSKMAREWVIWTNHYAESAVFYSIEGNTIIVGSSFDYVNDGLKKLGVETSLNRKAVLCMLTYGFMEEGITYVSEIRRLEPGHCLRITSEEVLDEVYWRLGDGKEDLSGATEEEIVEEFDKRFRTAVFRAFRKDEEYGFRHLVELSGGLDSRMVTWVAHDMGFRNVVNVDFCQSNYLDELVAKQIAGDLGNQIILEPLDDAGFLFELEELVKVNHGLTLYSGITGGKRVLDNLNMDSFGLVHTGALGDVVAGSFLKSAEEAKDTSLDGLYSSRLLDKIEPLSIRSRYADKETFLFYTRGFLGAVASNIFRKSYTETASPFLDVDVLDYCMGIPQNLRMHHRFYRTWILDYYPNAGHYIWEKKGVPLDITPARHFAVRIKRTLKRIPAVLTGKNNPQMKGMNPFERWFAERPEIELFFNRYFDAHIDHPVIPGDLREDLQLLFHEGVGFEKTQALTVLAAIDLYFEESA